MLAFTSVCPACMHILRMWQLRWIYNCSRKKQHGFFANAMMHYTSSFIVCPNCPEILVALEKKKKQKINTLTTLRIWFVPVEKVSMRGAAPDTVSLHSIRRPLVVQRPTAIMTSGLGPLSQWQLTGENYIDSEQRKRHRWDSLNESTLHLLHLNVNNVDFRYEYLLGFLFIVYFFVWLFHFF